MIQINAMLYEYRFIRARLAKYISSSTQLIGQCLVYFGYVRLIFILYNEMVCCKHFYQRDSCEFDTGKMIILFTRCKPYIAR